MKKKVFDLDNTLIYTDFLNNEAYNYALKESGLDPIKTSGRITKEVVFEKYSNLSSEKKKEIVEKKQNYFIQNLQATKGNEELIKVLKSENKENCILWTSADKARVEILLEHYKIENMFKNIIFSPKNKVENDIKEICKVHNCKKEYLFFYEDDLNVRKQLKDLKIDINII